MPIEPQHMKAIQNGDGQSCSTASSPGTSREASPVRTMDDLLRDTVSHYVRQVNDELSSSELSSGQSSPTNNNITAM